MRGWDRQRKPESGQHDRGVASGSPSQALGPDVDRLLRIQQTAGNRAALGLLARTPDDDDDPGFSRDPREAQKIGSAGEREEIGRVRLELAKKGYGTVYDRHDIALMKRNIDAGKANKPPRIDEWLVETFPDGRARPELVAIDHRGKRILVLDLTASASSSAAAKPGDVQKLPADASDVDRGKHHLEKTKAYGEQVARRLPPRYKGYTITARDRYWRTGKYSVEVPIRTPPPPPPPPPKPKYDPKTAVKVRKKPPNPSGSSTPPPTPTTKDPPTAPSSPPRGDPTLEPLKHPVGKPHFKPQPLDKPAKTPPPAPTVKAPTPPAPTPAQPATQPSADHVRDAAKRRAQGSPRRDQTLGGSTTSGPKGSRQTSMGVSRGPHMQAAGVLIQSAVSWSGDKTLNHAVAREMLREWPKIEEWRASYPSDKIVFEVWLTEWDVADAAGSRARMVHEVHPYHGPTVADVERQIAQAGRIDAPDKGWHLVGPYMGWIEPHENLDKLKEKAENAGWCFIATACYGSPDAPEVMTLRTFRDRVLEPRRLGRIAVRAYYRASPAPARAIARRPRLRRAVRSALVGPAAAAARRSLDRNE